jgi:AraC-like DNA-binding protein
LVSQEDACRNSGIAAIVSSEYSGEPRAHRALPSLTARLVLSLDGAFELTYGDQVVKRQAVVAGLMRPDLPAPALLLRPHQRSVYVDLSPRAAQRLLSVPLRFIDAGGVDAADVLPWMGSLADELAERKTHTERECVMRDRLLQRLADSAEPRSTDTWAALELLRRSGGCLSAVELARRMRLSTRQLRHVMNRDAGVGPKFAGRVARFAAGIRRASIGASSWSMVAADVGFYDQSHLVGEFQTLMGTTPTQWLAEERRNLQGWRHIGS